MKTDAANQPMNVGEYLDAWLDHARGRVRVRTWEGYNADLLVQAREHAAVISKKLGEV